MQWDIPGGNGQLFALLNIVCHANKQCSVRAARGAQSRQGTVIKAATHAEPMTLLVEAEQGCDDDIEPLGFADLGRSIDRFRNIETIQLHRCRWRPGHEPQPPRQEWVQDRQVALLACTEGKVQQRHWIKLALAADIGRDPPRALERCQCGNTFGDRERRVLLFGG